MSIRHEVSYAGLEAIEGGLRRYIEEGVETGGFIMAMLTNDLRRTFERADLYNRKRIEQYVEWLYNRAPSECWGSEAKVKRWMEIGGLVGLSLKAMKEREQQA